MVHTFDIVIRVTVETDLSQKQAILDLNDNGDYNIIGTNRVRIKDLEWVDEYSKERQVASGIINSLIEEEKPFIPSVTVAEVMTGIFKKEVLPELFNSIKEGEIICFKQILRYCKDHPKLKIVFDVDSTQFKLVLRRVLEYLDKRLFIKNHGYCGNSNDGFTYTKLRKI